MIQNMINQYYFFFRSFALYLTILIFFLVDSPSHLYYCNAQKMQSTVVQIGVVLDLESPLGSMAALCMQMAISDFYSARPNYTTRLQLRFKNAKGVFHENFAVLDLLKQEQVHGIIGPQEQIEEEFISVLGNKVHVPILSFTARTSALPYSKDTYFIRTTQDDAIQIQALAAICQEFQWPQVVVLYEATEYGNQSISQLNTLFQDVGIVLSQTIAFPESSDDSYIMRELNKLSIIQTRVYIVHMNPSLGSRLFILAKRIGMMSEGYAWIMTDSLSIFMDSMDSKARDSMQGVLGIRPYVLVTNKLLKFQERWKRKVFSQRNMGWIIDLNVYGLWAYDTVTALGTAIEKIGPLNSSLLYESSINGTNLRISGFGPRLMNELSSTKFRGLSGDFELVDAKLRALPIEIFNVIGTGERNVGFWTIDKGIIRELIIRELISSSRNDLRRVMWPGDTLTQPKGWSILPNGKLRVGVPWKPGFKDFGSVNIDPITNHINATGFSIDIFIAALNVIPFPINYEFICYNDSKSTNWSHDDMLRRIPQDYDMVAADTTLWAPRALFVDFSLPYSESGVVLVVKNKKPSDMWIFVKPLRWDLWLAIIVACILMGAALHLLEHRRVNGGQDSVRPDDGRPSRAYLSPISVLAFPERNMASNSWSFFVLLCWLFMAFILMQSFTANLSAILTIDQIKFAFSEDYYIGYHTGSFMKQFLVDQLHIDPLRLRSYESIEAFHDGMSLGSKNGGVDAIFDEEPYLKSLINKYNPQYKIVGPTYRTGGLGFSFPIGSPLVAYFSRAILNVTQGPEMNYIVQKNFGPGYSSQDPLSSTISQGTRSLTFYEFSGLFLLIGLLTVFAVVCSWANVGQRFSAFTNYAKGKIFGSTRPQVHPDLSPRTQSGGEDQENHDANDANDVTSSSQEENGEVYETIVNDVGVRNQ